MRVHEFAPHDLEDVFALCQTLGRELAGAAAAARFERQIARPLALVAGRSSSTDRPRVAVIVDSDADGPRLAGGHSFATDLVEISGGTSVTHGDEDHRHSLEHVDLVSLAPDLVLVLSAEIGEERKRVIRDALPVQLPVVFYSLDPTTFWWDAPADHAEMIFDVLREFSPGADDRLSR